jgi:hypothetical protein
MANNAAREPPDATLPADLRTLFSPIHKTAFATALGLTAALAVAVLTVFHVLVAPQDGPNLGLLSQFFFGYSVSWQGVVIGAFWAGVAGFVMGWFAAFVRNLVIAVWLFLVKARAELSQAADFLSHI